jgi:hypothetical protein
VYIKRIVLENLRGFRKLDFDLTRPDGTYAGWSVITGDNASGKTAMLKSIAFAVLGADSARVLQQSLRGWIRSGQREAFISVQIVPGEDDRFVTGRRPESLWAELHLRCASNSDSTVSMAPGKRYGPRGKKGPTHGPWAENPQGWFAMGYGPFRRLYGASPEAQRIMSGPERLARFATMFREDATLGECEAWLRSLHHKKLEEKPRETAILEMIVRLLNDEFMRQGFRVDHVDSDGLWLRDASKAILPLADMSEGYRASLAMLLDLLQHMIDVFGHENLLEEGPDGNLSVTRPGVVLIDEVDSHLHPEWQREIGFWFKKRFPKVQFIVTTHSAMVCTAADERGLFHLPSPGDQGEPFAVSDEDYWKVIKSTPTEIFMSPAFNMKQTRSPRAVAARMDYARLRAKARAHPLSAHEESEKEQLRLWVEDDGNEQSGAGL